MYSEYVRYPNQRSGPVLASYEIWKAYLAKEISEQDWLLII